MKNEKTVLVVDDKRANADDIAQLCKEAGFKAVVALDKKHALNEIGAHGFYAALVDVFLQDYKSEPRSSWKAEGVEVCRALTQKQPLCGTVLYSRGFTEEEKRSIWFRSAEQLHVPVKTFDGIADLNPDQLNDYLGEVAEKAIKDRGATIEIEFERSLLTFEIKEAVGAFTLSKLLEDQLGSESRMSLKAISGGFSDAYVAQVGSQTAHGESLELLIKISRNKEGLENEVDGAPQAGTTIYRRTVQLSKDIAHYDGWSAAVMPYIANSRTLAQYLHENADTQPTKGWKAAFRGLLQDITPAGVPLTTRLDASSYHYTLSAKFAREVVDMVSSLKEAGASSTSALNTELEWVREGIDKAFWASNQLFPNTNRIAGVHGDLHARNILVGESGTGIDLSVIDFARKFEGPRLYDLATLYVDVSLAGVQLMNTEGEESLNRAVGSISKILSGKKPRNSPFPKRVAGCLIEVVKICGCESSTAEYVEFLDSVLHEYLRFLRFSALPMSARKVCVKAVKQLTEESGAGVLS